MNKYICIDKKHKKLKNFGIFKDELNGKYRLADLDNGSIFSNEFNSEKEIKVLLEVHYKIKEKKDLI